MAVHSLNQWSPIVLIIYPIILEGTSPGYEHIFNYRLP